MAQSSMFWDGTTTGDATSAPYDAANAFAKFVLELTGMGGNVNLGGVLNGELNSLTPSVSGQTVSIASGRAFVDGTFYESTAVEQFVLSVPASGTRVDLIVAEKDWSLKKVRLVKIAGTEGGGAPAMNQSLGSKWDIPIAQISTTTLSVSTITDTRSYYSASSGAQVGDLKATYRNTNDTGWALCYGQTVDATAGTQYANLWAYISANGLVGAGKPWTGTQGALVFPDLRGMALVGLDTMGGSARNKITALAVLGNTTGEATHTLTKAESAVLTYTSTVTDPGHQHFEYGSSNTGANNFPPSLAVTGNNFESNSLTASATTGITVGTTADAGGGAHNNVQPSAATNIMVKL